MLKKRKQNSMASFLLVMNFLLLGLCFAFLSCAGQDSLGIGNSISEKETIISLGGVFCLGFFNPAGNSSRNRYVGIWYNKISVRTVLWVANRENPINTSTSGIMKIIDDGNLGVMDGNGKLLWSSNVTKAMGNTTTTLLDTGNLVLSEVIGGNQIWQSFDHPTDTLLPGMRLRMNLKTSIPQCVFAWKTSIDPSPGNVYASFDPNSPLQVILWRGSDVLWRFGIWNNQQLTTNRAGNGSSLLVDTLAFSSDEIYYSYTATDQLSMLRLFLDPSGKLNSSVGRTPYPWVPQGSVPSLPCEVYNICGNYGICNASKSLNQACNCMQGFVPNNQLDWVKGNFSGGCGRKIKLKCDGSDQFVKLIAASFPDHFTFKRNLSAEQCYKECSENCNCTAYAFSDVSTANLKDLRCFTWHGELKDITYDSSNGGDFYVRVATIDSSSKNKHIVLPILLPIAISLIFLVLLCYVKGRIKTKGQVKLGKTIVTTVPPHNNFIGTMEIETDGSELPLIDIDSVIGATNNFCTENKLGEGGFGPVYKGTLSNGQEIAVKRLSKSSGQGFQEFKTEIELIAKLQHANLVRLIGWCAPVEEKILVYEYLPNKSLDKFIFDPTLSQAISWSQRYCIIEGIAQGLLYLHKYSRLRIIHRDLKSSNILLDKDMNPKISDFGLARIFRGNQTEANTSKIVGTYGYMSPEYALDGCFSEKSDVFSFGVIVLEIITGKKSTGFYPHKDTFNLLGFVSHLWEDGKLVELINSSIEVTPAITTQISKCLQVALLCVEDNATDRPSMTSVVTMLCSENPTMPTPRQPAFAFRRDPTNATPPSSSSYELVSASNEITITSIQGR